MTGKIKYKVVTGNRKSIIIPEGSKFCLTYNKGDIIKALPETLGIMVFKSLYNANMFNFFDGIIIKVRPIGKKKPTPDHIAVTYHGSRQTTQAIKKFNRSIQVRILPVPDGTECYDAVEVLE